MWSETIAAYGYDDCPPHPAWMEPFERLGGVGSGRWPLHLVSNQPVRACTANMTMPLPAR